jgi:hypothetical protein
VDLVVNIPKDLTASELDNDYSIRGLQSIFNIPLITNARLGSAFILAFADWVRISWQSRAGTSISRRRTIGREGRGEMR